MDELIKIEIDEIRKDIPKIKDLNEEYLFSLVCYKYFYNNGYLSYKDYKEIFVDGKNDGGIDLIFVNDIDELQTLLVIAQSKCTCSISSKQEIIDIFTKIDQTINNFKLNRTSSYNDRLRRIFKDKLSYIEGLNAIYELVLFICCNVSEKYQKEIEQSINNISSLEQYKISIMFENDIINQIKKIKEPKRYVPEAKITYIKSDGMLKYRDNGVLINVSSNSIKDLYDRFKDNGLFEQNFRYYFSQKKIDDNINLSLKDRREDFWFLNNGIIIGCSDFWFDGNKVVLQNFSIINGCQTTTLIGKYQGKNQDVDFAIPCKIVKPKNQEDSEKFIADIAEASNSQKPISDRDLKSNATEQRKLKQQLLNNNPPIYLEIKRGEQKISKKGKQDWQFIRNDVLGQLILSFNLQQPGTARSNKSKIFSDNQVYYKVFRRKHDIKTIIDLLKINYYYSCYCDSLESNNNIIDPDHESIVYNGRFYVIAIIGFMIKAKRKLIDFSLAQDEEVWELEIGTDNISGSLFSCYDGTDFRDILDGLFSFIVYQLYSVYTQRSKEEKTVSNFFKTDAKYRNIIIKHLIQKVYQIKIERNKLENDYLKILQ